MYSTCIHCHAPLGANESVKLCPIGRRIAFDTRRRRLWIVCRRCREWNLTPIEERWEAIEDCERRFRGTRLPASTDHIGLARLRDDMELVRIGEPLRPEMAAWRYGAEFKRRRSSAIATGAAYQAPLYAFNVLLNASMISYTVSTVGVGLGIGAMVLHLRSQWTTRIMSADGYAMHTFLFWMPWSGGMVLLPSLLRDPAKFLAGAWMYKLPLAVVAGFIGACVSWHLTSPQLFAIRLAAKRTRDALLENR